MITRAIVDSIVDSYHVRIRIPEIDRVDYVSTKTSKKELNVATICTLPRSNISFEPGDVVYVAFEDMDKSKVVILGTLFRDALNNSNIDLTSQELKILKSAELPAETNIGDVTPVQIEYLKHIKNDISSIINRLNIIEKTLNLQ